MSKEWNKTRLFKILTATLFVVIIPALYFYAGTKYRNGKLAKELLELQFGEIDSQFQNYISTEQPMMLENSLMQDLPTSFASSIPSIDPVAVNNTMVIEGQDRLLNRLDLQCDENKKRLMTS